MQTLWFIAIAALWSLYLVLAGFDFGVGMLLRRVRSDHYDRRVALHAIGPTWTANEVWVVIAVVAMLAAFPGWYGAWAASFYVPLTLVLLAVIARNVAIELIGKREDEAWRLGWERVLVVSSHVAPFCWGLIWGGALDGVALHGDGSASGGAFGWLSWLGVLTGIALVALCRALGAAFLAARTGEPTMAPAPGAGAAAAEVADSVGARATRSLRGSAVGAIAAGGAVLVWAATLGLGVAGWVALCLCGVGLAGLVLRRRPFISGCLSVAAFVAVWFCALWPNGLGGSTPLPLSTVVAGDYSLTLLTILAGVLSPLLLALQAWSYWLFRERVTRAAVGAPLPTPIDLIARVTERRG